MEKYPISKRNNSPFPKNFVKNMQKLYKFLNFTQGHLKKKLNKWGNLHTRFLIMNGMAY